MSQDGYTGLTSASSSTLTNKTIDAGNNTIKIEVITVTENTVLTAAQCYGSVVYVTGAATVTLPAIADGMSLRVITIGTIAVSVDPNANDSIYLDSSATTGDGKKITNTSTDGDEAVLTYYNATGWYASTNSWTQEA